MERMIMSIGQSTSIKGELTANEDLIVNGKVEGLIDASDHVLTVGQGGRLTAQVFARVIVVVGSVLGNLTATEKIQIMEHGCVEGDISAPKVAITDGAQFRGKIDMPRSKTATNSQGPNTARPAATPLAPVAQRQTVAV